MGIKMDIVGQKHLKFIFTSDWALYIDIYVPFLSFLHKFIIECKLKAIRQLFETVKIE